MVEKHLLVAIKRCIAATFNYASWIELGYFTECSQIIEGHGRLLRSMQFGDDDYEGNILEVVNTLIGKNPENLNVIVQYTHLREWLGEYDRPLFSLLFANSEMVLGEVTQVSIRTSVDLTHSIDRIRRAVEIDPELAIGSTKEMLEAVLKTILKASGEEVDNVEFPKLLRRAQKVLKLDPDEVNPNVKGANIVRRILSSLGQLAQGINELRNIYGTGHGRVQQSRVSGRHARLVVNSGAALAIFLMETYEHHTQQS
jgi:hypothetical protein